MYSRLGSSISVLSFNTDLPFNGDSANDSIFLSLNWSMSDVSLPDAVESAGEHKLRLLRVVLRFGVVLPPWERAGDTALVLGIFTTFSYLKL